MAEKKGLSIASLVCGLLFWFSLPGMVCSILAIVFGAIQLKNIKKNPKQYGGKGMATAGLVLGIIGIVFWLLILILIGAAFTTLV
jgi:hypothetical protein